MTLNILILIAGFILIAKAADLLVEASAFIARKHQLSPLLIGLTIVAFGTSAPEMVVSLFASFNDSPSLAVGNAIGSNIANIGLVLGLTSLIQPVTIHSGIIRREYPLLLLSRFLVLFLILDNHLSQLDGLLLLLALAAFITFLIRQAKRQDDPLQKEFEQELPSQMKRPWLWLLASLLLLPLSAEMIIYSASNIARLFGLSDAVIGLTIIALGTSLPEVATSITGVLKKEADIAIGNILGSNIFNLLAVLPLAASKKNVFISPTFIERDFFIMVAFSVVLMIVSFYRAALPRLFALMLLLSYILYFGFLLIRQ
jgi:cation:H+ antiporter